MELKIKEILRNVLSEDVAVDNLTLEANFVNELGVDSYDFINFLFEIEEEFGIEINYEEFNASNFNTLNDIINYIESNKE